MRDRCLGILLILAVTGLCQPCCAEEFAGKLERVDLESVTLLGSDNQRVVIRVDRGSRQAAAPFLGKWVTVDFRNEGGYCQALRFRSGR
ncbi:MAG: hypothetical protein ACLP5H_12250 [Desulfomonilaceae bacterium]